jgi:hypothetical protein
MELEHRMMRRVGLYVNCFPAAVWRGIQRHLQVLYSVNREPVSTKFTSLIKHNQRYHAIELELGMPHL